jgi:peptidoglycan/LPS O-acetylase OafA/YrhL
MADGKRVLQLDGLRGLAILAVFIHHAWRARLLWMGVDLFFVLSGFLITGILLNSKDRPFRSYIGYFYARRARRILPPYIVIMIITTAIFGTAWMANWYYYLGGMNFLSVFHKTELETLPLWSLAVEEQFYLLWPFAVYYLSRENLLRLCCLLLVLAPAFRFLCTPLFQTHGAIYLLLPFRMDTLAAGALLAILWPTHGSRFKARVFVTLSLSSLAVLILLAMHHITTTANTRVGNLIIYEATLAICSSLFILALMGVGKPFLTSVPMVWLGTISYSIYLFHMTALHLAPNLGLGILLVLAYATAMWFLIERPITRYKPRLTESVQNT